MVRRGRPRKIGQARMDAAIDALHPMGYDIPLIRRKVNELLEIYQGHWEIIEQGPYIILIEAILEEQEQEQKMITNNKDNEDSNDHDDTDPSDAHAGRDVTCLPPAEEWKDISCMDHDCPQDMEIVTACKTNDGQENGVGRLEENELQGPVDLLPPRRRKPCYGWIRGDSSDNEEGLVFFETEASRRKEMTRKVGYAKSRKSRWDMREPL